jgi:adenylate cyclase
LWLRVKAHYRKVAPVLLALAVFVPTMALLGVFQGARQVIEKAQLDPTWLAAFRRAGRGADPVVNNTLSEIVYWLWAGFAGLLILVLIARGVRALIARRGGSIRVIYPDGRAVRIPKGSTLAGAPASPTLRCAAVGRAARPAGCACCSDWTACRRRHR